MHRRRFISLSGIFAVGRPLAARAQQDVAVRRLGVLMPFSADDPEIKTELGAFGLQLRRLGWTEGGNLRVDYRFSGGDSQKLQAYAKELVALNPDVIFTRSTPATAALFKDTRSIPIVFAVVSDPIGEGFVASLARPGGNVTGFTNAEETLTGKWLSLLKQVAPALGRLGFIFDPKMAPLGGAYYTGLIKTAASSYSVIPLAMPVHDAGDIERSIDDFARSPDGGLVVLPDATTNIHRAEIIALAARNRLPAIYAFHNLAKEGGLMSYGVDVPHLFQNAATYIDRILKGDKPSDLPVQLPEKFELVINMKTAASLGIAVPQNLIVAADNLIE
jgi:putative ABC transport system substrate-binding protein